MNIETPSKSFAASGPGPPGVGACPTNSDLALHLAGDAGEADSPVALHLKTCARCQLLANVVHTAILTFAGK